MSTGTGIGKKRLYSGNEDTDAGILATEEKKTQINHVNGGFNEFDSKEAENSLTVTIVTEERNDDISGDEVIDNEEESVGDEDIMIHIQEQSYLEHDENTENAERDIKLDKPP